VSQPARHSSLLLSASERQDYEADAAESRRRYNAAWLEVEQRTPLKELRSFFLPFGVLYRPLRRDTIGAGYGRQLSAMEAARHKLAAGLVTQAEYDMLVRSWEAHQEMTGGML
jgi:hypothetical protein